MSSARRSSGISLTVAIAIVLLLSSLSCSSGKSAYVGTWSNEMARLVLNTDGTGVMGNASEGMSLKWKMAGDGIEIRESEPNREHASEFLTASLSDDGKSLILKLPGKSIILVRQ